MRAADPALPAPASPPAAGVFTGIVGVVGLGIMGSQYAAHMLAAGLRVVGYDIAADRMRSFREAGGTAAGTPDEVVEASDVVVVSLSSAAAFRTTLLDADAAGRKARRGQVFVETGTLDIAMKEQARSIVEARGARMIDAPVTGTRLHAERRELVMYASGREDDVAAVRPVLETFARDVRHVGPFGNGMKFKMITNHLVAVHNVATAEALSFARAAGLDLQAVYDLVSSGPATSAVFNFRGPLMVDGTYDQPTMRLDVFEKDIDLIDDFARSVRAPTPLFHAGLQFYRAALARGMNGQDVSAVFELFGALSRPDA